MIKDKNAELLCHLLNEAYPGKWVDEQTVLQGRKFRFDACNYSDKILIEIDGGIYPFWTTLKNGQKVKASAGGHSSAAGIQRDMEKTNAAQVEGWKVLRYTPETLRKAPHKIMKDLWLLIGQPKGKLNTAQLELTCMVQQRL